MIYSRYSLAWQPMTKTLFVILLSPTSSLSPNASILMKRKNTSVRESEIYGQIRVGGSDIL